MRVELNPELERLVEQRLASGRYRDPEHVLGDALRTLELVDRERGDGADASLRALIAEGDTSGDPEAYDMAAIQARLDDESPAKA
jgi:putative addiction module CopG family antidote